VSSNFSSSVMARTCATGAPGGGGFGSGAADGLGGCGLGGSAGGVAGRADRAQEVWSRDCTEGLGDGPTGDVSEGVARDNED
jgi:hypothetical protein